MKTFLRNSLLQFIMVTLVLSFILTTNASAQIPSTGGSYTIDTTLANSFTGGATGNFKSFKRAIAALNATSAGTINSNVTFTVTSGQSFGENPLFITYTNVNAFNPKITFVKSSGSDPVLLGTGGVTTGGVSVGDAIIKITGGSNYVFNGIDLKDNPTNSNSTLGMEYGLWLLTNQTAGLPGCNNNIYENGTITLNQGVTNTTITYGVYVEMNVNNGANVNNNNLFYNNTISTVNAGYYFAGANGNFPDVGNKITTIGGGTSTIVNNKVIGGNTYGVLFWYQSTFEVSNTNINNTAVGGTLAGSVYGIACGTSSPGTSSGGTVNIYGNTVINFTGNTNVYGIYTFMSNLSATINIHDNTLSTLKSTSTSGGGAYGIINTGTANPGGVYTIYNNSISTIQNTGTSTSANTNTAGIYSTTITTNKIFANIINGVSSSISSNTSGSANTYGIYHNGASANSIDTMYNNTVSNITVSATSATGSVYGLYTGGQGHSTIYKNKISAVTANSYTSTTNPFPVVGIQVGAAAAMAGCDVYSNSISTIQGHTNLVAGIVQNTQTTGSTNNYYQNNINGINNVSSWAGGLVTTGTFGILVADVFTHNENIYLDTILNVGNTAINGTGQVAGISVNSVGALNRIYNDTISKISSATTAAQVVPVVSGVSGIYLTGNATLDSIFNCRINNVTSAATTGATNVNGLYVANIGTRVVFGNIINNILNTGGGANIGQYTGIYVQNNNTANIFKNLVNTVYSKTTTTGTAIGIQSFGNSSSTTNIYNNMVYDIRADANNGAIGTPSVRGIGTLTGSTLTQNVYFNTVYLNGVATSTGNRSAAFYSNNATANALTLRNNIFDNEYNVATNTVANAVASAVYFANGLETFINSNSNNNVVYNGKNQGYFNVNRNLDFFEGNLANIPKDSAANQTDYRADFTSPAEQQTIADQPVNYVNTASLPYDLHLNTGPCNSLSGSPALFNAVTIPTYTTDFDGNIRGTGSTLGSSPSPTVGADEPGGPYRTSNNSVANTIKGLTTVCQGVSATYSIPPITSPNPATGYSWTFLPTGNTATGSNAQSNTFATAGPAQVQVSETGPCSLQSDVSLLNVNVLSSTVGTPATPSGIITRCQGSGSNVYIVNNNQQGYTYNWTIAAGASTILGSVPGCTNCSLTSTGIGPMATVNWDPTYSGTAVITVSATNGCGTSTTSSLNVTVNPSPAAAGAISGPASVCLGQSGVVYSVSTITNATSYNWVIPPTGVSIVGASTNNSITLNFSGSAVSGNLIINGLDGCGSGANSTSAITVHSLPVVTVSVSNPVSGSICQLDSGTLVTSGASSYLWSPSSGLSFTTGTSVNASPLSTTTYTVIGTDGNNCSNSVTTTLTVKSLPTLSVSPQSAVCTGGTTATLTASGTSATYTWSPNIDINTTTGAVVTASISNLTFYTVTGTGANSCTAQVIIPVATVATGGTISPTTSIICSGGTKLLTVTGAAGHDYQWQISTDNTTWTNIPSATNTTYTTASGDGLTLKYYRLISNSNTCWNVASTVAIVDISNPAIIVTASGITDQSITLNWMPVGFGNYTVSYTGASSGNSFNVTPAKTLTGLTPGGNYSITVTQTGVTGCPASGTITAITLCGAPTGVTATTPTNNEMIVNWTGPVANYRVFYRPLYTAGTYYTKDVIGATSATITKQGSSVLPSSTTYEVYVTTLDCPTAGVIGQPTPDIYVTTPPAKVCPAPVIDSVKSTCPVQIEVWMHPGSSPTGNYQIYFQRVTPSIQGVVSYPVSGNYFTVNIGSAGQTYLITAAANCGGNSYSNLVIWPGNVTVKPLCSTINNLVLSNATCHGFTASWNIDQCLSNNVSYYQVFLRPKGSVNWNSYPVQPVPPAPIGPFKLINWLTKGTIYEVYVRSIYTCNGYITTGPSSQILTDTTLSAGCKDDEQDVAPTQPSVQQYSQDKSEVLNIYPNPNNGEFMLDISQLNNTDAAVRVEIMNMLGQTVMTDLTNISGGHLTEFLRLPNTTASGNYFVRVTVGKNVYTTKVNISR